MIVIYIDGKPIPLKRHRSRKWGDKVISYDSQIEQKKQVIAKVLENICKLDPMPSEYPIFSGPIKAKMFFQYKMPKTGKKKIADRGYIKMTRPDLSNLIKFYEDCIHEIVYADDAQIVEIEAKKYYHDKDGVVLMFENA